MQLPTKNPNKKKKPTLLTPQGTSTATLKKPEASTQAGTRVGAVGTPAAGAVRKPATGGTLPVRTPAAPAGGTTSRTQASGSSASGSRVNYAGGMRFPYPDPTNPLLTERGAEKKYGGSPQIKSITELYLSNRDNPAVDELVAEEEARLESEEKRKDPANMEAVGKAMYESVMQGPDRATEAARRAEENAYDLARRGAGGAGTSYAAMAGAKAYQDAYAAETDRIQAEKDAERDRLTDTFGLVMDMYDGTNGDSLRQYLSMEGFAQSDIDSMMSVVEEDYNAYQGKLEAEEKEAADALAAEEYEATRNAVTEWAMANGESLSEEQLRAYARNRGLSDLDIDDIVLMVGYDELNRRPIDPELTNLYDIMAERAEAGASLEELWAAGRLVGATNQQILDILTVIDPYPVVDAYVDANGMPVTGVGGSTAGYDENAVTDIYETLVQAGDDGVPYYTGDNRKTVETILKNAGYSAGDIEEAMRRADENFQAGTMDMVGAMSNAVIKNDTAGAYELAGKTEAEWAEMDDEERSAALLDGMRSLIELGKTDTTAFAEASKALAVENVQAAIDETNDRNMLEVRWDRVRGKEGEDILLSAADAVVGLKDDLKNGYLTEEQYRDCLVAVGETAKITEVYEKNQKETASSVGNKILRGLSGIWLSKVIVDVVNWPPEKQRALDELLKVMETGNG